MFDKILSKPLQRVFACYKDLEVVRRPVLIVYGLNMISENVKSLVQGSLTHFSRVVFYIETSHLICTASQMAGFCIKCNFGVKWVNAFQINNSLI